MEADPSDVIRRAASSAGLTSAAPNRAGSRRCPRSRPASTSTLPPG